MRTSQAPAYRQWWQPRRTLLEAQLRTKLTYRANYLFQLATLLLQVYLLKLIWVSVYPDSGTAVSAAGGDIKLDTQLSYTIMASLQSWLFHSFGFWVVSERVQSGRIAVDLTRPVGLPSQLFWTQAGNILAMLPFAALTLPFAMFGGGMQKPASPGAGVGYLLSMLIACFCSILLSIIVSLCALWTTEVYGVILIYRMAAQIFSGALIPLWFMSDWLADLSRWLPFQATTFSPVAIYLGQLTGLDRMGAIAVQIGWAVSLFLILQLVWWRARLRLISQGG